jgi:hypothetical protein
LKPKMKRSTGKGTEPPSRWSEGVTQGPSSPCLGMSPQGRTSYRKKNTREYRYLLDDQIGFGEKKRIDPLLKALILERATELSSQKAGRNVLPQNQECTVSPEVVKRLVHHLRKDEEREGKISEKKWKPARKKPPTSSSRPIGAMSLSRRGERRKEKEEARASCQTRLRP